MEYENIMATINAVNKIVTPIDSGFSIRNILIVKDEIVKINIVVIYNNEDCTHSLNIKGLCALYTILYMIMLFISRCIGISKFTLRQRSVSIMLLLQTQSGGEKKSDVKLLDLSILVGMLSQLIRGHHGILWPQRK